MDPRLSGERCFSDTSPNSSVYISNRLVMKTHPRCWHCRSPTHGQCFLGPSSSPSQDRSSITWLGAPKQRSRSIGLAEQTGKSRTENQHGTHRHPEERIGRAGRRRRRRRRTCVEGTTEVGATVALAPAGAPGLSPGCIVTALTPHTQLPVAALLVHRTRLPEERTVWGLFSKDPAGG